MKLLKQIKWDTLLMGVLYILLGIVALVIPETMERLLGFLIGTVLIIAGAVSMISYLLRDAHQNYYHNDFLHGLLGILLGIVVLYNVDIIISLVPRLLGTLVLVSGLSKLQDVIDLKRMEYGNWIFMLVLAIINVTLGLVLIFNPMAIAELLFRLIGIGLIFSGITDCITTVYFARKIRNYLAEVNAVDSTFVEIVDEGKGTGAKGFGKSVKKKSKAEDIGGTAGKDTGAEDVGGAAGKDTKAEDTGRDAGKGILAEDSGSAVGKNGKSADARMTMEKAASAQGVWAAAGESVETNRAEAAAGKSVETNGAGESAEPNGTGTGAGKSAEPNGAGTGAGKSAEPQSAGTAVKISSGAENVDTKE